ncbi:MAG TPA: STAS domain-containing protein [Steroidobacteraceae bacterium]|nr:STAS domain-containing protein [Steroidobacteraceae bacterium]
MIALPAQCLLPAIRGLHELLSPHLEAAAVMLDVSALQRIDTGSMQLIAAFALDRARAGRALERHGDSPAWDEAVRLLGMNSILPAQPHSPPQPHQRPMP